MDAVNPEPSGRNRSPSSGGRTGGRSTGGSGRGGPDSARNERNGIVFFICVGVSFLLWMMIQLSEEQVSDIRIRLSYTNMPADKVVVNKLPQQALVKVRGNGWQLLFSLFRQREVNLDMDRLGERSLVLTNYNINLFSRDLPADFQILHIDPDSISIDFDKRVERRIPIRFDSKLEFMPSFGIVGAIQLDPDSVTISGAASMIDTLQSWATERITAKGVNANLAGTADLLGTGRENLSLDAATVSFRMEVSEFTERSLDVRLQTVGGVRDSTLRILPHLIRVSFEVPISRYDEVVAEQFSAVVDLAGLKDTSDNLLDVRLDRIPPLVRRVSFQPPYAEYFFVKQPTRKELRQMKRN